MTESDENRWLTYAELGERLGCTANAARMHAKRRGWLHRAPNMIGGRATVLAPVELVVRPVLQHSAALCDEDVEEGPHNGAGSVRALEQAISALNEALSAERARSERIEADNRDLRQAERIARDEAAGLRTELDARKHWGLWRRVKGR